MCLFHIVTWWIVLIIFIILWYLMPLRVRHDGMVTMFHSLSDFFLCVCQGQICFCNYKLVSFLLNSKWRPCKGDKTNLFSFEIAAIKWNMRTHELVTFLFQIIISPLFCFAHFCESKSLFTLCQDEVAWH